MCAVAVVGAVVAAASTAASMVMQQKQSKYNQAVAANEAQAARWQQADALARGAEEQGLIKQEGSKIAGTALASAAANQAETTTGSTANIFAASAMNVATDVERAKANAARQAWGFGTEADAAIAKKRMIRSSSILGSIGSGIQGFGSAAGQAYGAGSDKGWW